MSKSLRQPNVPLRRTRTCLFCNGPATVLAPRGSSDLDVDAEFSSAGRQFADTEDGDPIGVGCYRCSRERWSVKERRTRDAGYRP